MQTDFGELKLASAADAEGYAEDVIDLTLNEAIPFYNRAN